MKALGQIKWAISGGHIPLRSNGAEPAFTSRDYLSILNTSDEEEKVSIDIYFEASKQFGPYEINIKARRMRKIRINDLIDPLPIPLDTGYGAVVSSSHNIIVQFSRMDTSHTHNTGFTTTPFSQNNN